MLLDCGQIQGKSLSTVCVMIFTLHTYALSIFFVCSPKPWRSFMKVPFHRAHIHIHIAAALSVWSLATPGITFAQNTAANSAEIQNINVIS